MHTDVPSLDSEQEFPAEFDHAIYVGHPDNPDLLGLDPTDAWHHYETYGRHEGRACSAIDSRPAFLALIADHGSFLEIGPRWCSALDRSRRTVRTLDILSTKELYSLSIEQGAGPTDIPEIDFVWRGQPYHELTTERFDAILAVRSLERQTCLITHLTDAASLLRPGGRLFLVLGDRRFSSYHYLPDTTLPDLLDAFATSRTGRSTRSVMANRLWRTHDDADAHWAGRHGADPRHQAPDPRLVQEIAALLRAIRTAGHPPDVAAWHFTPDSFRYLIETLAAIGLSPFRVERLYPTRRPSSEFYAVLRIAA
ncbi:MAG TPA: hypothetical protein VIZ17_13890 [Acetobacteraceae bacterium]